MPPPAARHDENEGAFTNPLKFLDQDYQKLLQQFLNRKNLYVDDVFPPDSSSIGDFSNKKSSTDYNQIVWKRPSELVPNPCFTVDGISRFDYEQGKLGNCWFLASVGALTSQTAIKDSVIPADQSFSKNYVGIFHFRFWRFGKWIDVVVDDLLPTINDKLVFVRSKTSNEFWPALLEKAYAKVCGSYADLISGRMSEALLDFTGGVHLYFRLNDAPAYLWNIMNRAAKSQTLMGCATYSKETSSEALSSSGIVAGHAYTVTGVLKVKNNGESVKLVRVLNPWGHKEWTGDWSDKSPLWKTVSVEDKKKCHEVLDNGEFWMSMKDFRKSFKRLDICCLSLDFLDISSKSHWTLQQNIGKWTETTAGGSMENTETFWKNPQFRIRIEEDGVDSSKKDAENILVSVIQNHEHRHRKSQKHTIGFYVFEVQAGPQQATIPVEEISSKSREVTKLFRLEPGEYLVVPCTDKPGNIASFVLSVLSMKEAHLHPI